MASGRRRLAALARRATGADATAPRKCSDEELRAVLCALLRRGSSRSTHGDPEVRLAPATRTLELSRARFHFGPVAFRVIGLLVNNRDRWVHRDEIIKSALGTYHQRGSSVVRVQIHQLRRTLGPYRACIQSDLLGGRGYMFAMHPSEPRSPLPEPLPHS